MVGALGLWAIVSGAPTYSRTGVGLGANGWGPHVSMTGIGVGSAFATEVALTFIFVVIVLVVTSRIGSPGLAGLAIGVGLVMVHLIGIALTGTSVNPARSLGPVVIVGHKALSQRPRPTALALRRIPLPDTRDTAGARRLAGCSSRSSRGRRAREIDRPRRDNESGLPTGRASSGRAVSSAHHSYVPQVRQEPDPQAIGPGFAARSPTTSVEPDRSPRVES